MKKFKMLHRMVVDLANDDTETYNKVIDLLSENLGPRFAFISQGPLSNFWDVAKRNYNMVRGTDLPWTGNLFEINGSRASNWMCYESFNRGRDQNRSWRVDGHEMVVAVDDDIIAVQLRLMLA